MRLITACVICSILAVGDARSELRTWTSAAGTQVQAKFVELRDTQVVLERPDGNRLGVAITDLSGADQKYLATILKPAEEDGFRIWTGLSGSTLFAKWISTSGDTTVVELRDGTQQNLSMILLSRVDQEFVEEMRAAEKRGGKDAADPDVISEAWEPGEWGGIGQTNRIAPQPKLVGVQRLGQKKTIVHYIGVHLASWEKTDKWPVIDLGIGPQDEKWQKNGPKILHEAKSSWLILRLIQAGSFMRGSPLGEIGRPKFGDLDPWPGGRKDIGMDRGSESQHEVRITQDFYMGIYEITQGQRAQIMFTRKKADPVKALGYNPANAARACTVITWLEARGGAQQNDPFMVCEGWWPGGKPAENSLVGVLSKRTGLEFDLPTEAQWEYACRAGTTTALNNGMNLTTAVGWCPNLDDVAWYKGNSIRGAYPQEVGLKRPNDWGLYDMHGLNEEWVLDIPSAYPKGGRHVDPVGGLRQPWLNHHPTAITRGGAAGVEPWYCRSAMRPFSTYGEAHGGLSVRVVAKVPPQRSRLGPR